MHNFLTRGGPTSPMHRALLAEAAEDLTARPDAGSPAEAVDGVSGIGRSMVHAGASEGRGRLLQTPTERLDAYKTAAVEKGHEVVAAHVVDEAGPYYAIVVLEGVERELSIPFEAALAIVTHAHTALWDDAVAFATQPEPIAGTEPWEEPDAEYRERLTGLDFISTIDKGQGRGSDLDYCGDLINLPRARLVPATTNRETRP